MEIDFQAPRDEIERGLVRMCESVLRVHPVGVRDNLFDLGADSLAAQRLISNIEKVFNKHLPPAVLFQSPTVEKIAEVLRYGEDGERWSSLVPVQTEGSQLPFFWIHGDVSTAFLSRYLGDDQPFYALDHQSQDGTPALHTEVESIAAYYLQEMLTVQRTGPYFIGGYSFGCIIALEVAQQLKRRQQETSFLALLDPPHLPSSREAGRRTRLTSSSLDTFRAKTADGYSIAKIAAAIYGAIEWRLASRLSPLKIGRKLIWRTCLTTGLRLPTAVRSAYVLDMYSRALRRYVPEPYHGNSILLMFTREFYPDSAGLRDWEQVLRGDVQVHELGADHMELRQESHVHLWAGKLRDGLLRTQINVPSMETTATVKV